MIEERSLYGKLPDQKLFTFLGQKTKLPQPNPPEPLILCGGIHIKQDRLIAGLHIDRFILMPGKDPLQPTLPTPRKESPLGTVLI